MSKTELVMECQGDDENGYRSSDGSIVLRRERNVTGWVLRVDGKKISTNRYRNVIASMYNYTLSIRNPNDI